MNSIDGDDDYVANTVTGFDWDAINRELTWQTPSAIPSALRVTPSTSSNSNYNETYEGLCSVPGVHQRRWHCGADRFHHCGVTDTVINYAAKGTLSANASTILAENGTTAWLTSTTAPRSS